jgi:multidrug resistance efflux pump
MTRVLVLPVALFATVMLALAEDQSRQNKSDEPDALDIEPAILKQNISNDLSSASDAKRDVAVVRCEKKLKEARGDAEGAERLCKVGVLSKVEMEHRFLKVIQCESDLASARVAFCKAEVDELESHIASGETATDELANATAALAQLTEAAQVATAKRERAELEAAEANLRRQQQLRKLGIARESDVTHAEEKLAELKLPKE